MSATDEEYWNGIIARAYPPSGVMPSVTIGPIQSSLTSLYLNGIKDANTTITYGEQSNFTCQITNSKFCAVYSNISGTMQKVAGLSKNSATYLNTLSAGSYKVIASTNTSGVSNVTFYETITKATPTLSLTSTPGNTNFSQNGTDLVFHFSITSINTQLNGNFYINGSLKNQSLSSGKYNAGNLVNLFIGTWNTSGNQNYTSASIRLARKIATGLLTLYLNGVENANKTITYGTQSNFTADISPTSDFVEIYVNGTKEALLAKGKATYLHSLSAGLYKVTAASNASGVSNVTFYETITKATPALSITDTPGNFTYNGTKDNTSATISTINGQLSASLYINGVKKSSTTTSTYYANATAGTYKGVFNTSGNQNYTSTSVSTQSIIRLVPPGINFYQIVSIDNAQTSATPSPFQQMVNLTINATNSKYINQTGHYAFQNVEFFNTTSGSIISSWLENYTKNYAVYWLKFPNGIPASTTLTDVAVGYATNTTNLLNTNNVGEAPQLSPTYGEYDDGANIFLTYNNGSNLFPSKQTGTGGSGPSTTTSAPNPYPHAITGSVNGGGAPANSWTTNGETSTTLPSSYIAQILVYITGSTPLTDLLTNVQNITTGQFYVFRFDARSGPDDLVGYYPSGATTTTVISTATTTSSTDTWYQMTAIDNADSLSLYKSTTSSLNNYGTEEVSSVTGKGYTGGGIAITTDGGTSSTYWARILVRAYPPSGVMPSVTIGSVQSAITLTLTQIYLNGIKDANTTITYGEQSNFTCQITNSKFCAI